MGILRRKEVEVIKPPTGGWLEYKLNKQEMDYVWKCINNKKNGCKRELVGQIKASHLLEDKGDWFYCNTVLPLIHEYAKQLRDLGNDVPLIQMHPLCMSQWWVNYQRQGEFNPVHDHSGVYSFVIWMKIPTNHFQQNKNPIALESNGGKISVFDFHYTDMMGYIRPFSYEMNPEMEGTMLFFPSDLKHSVYPFYNCEEERISVSGNIKVNTRVSR